MRLTRTFGLHAVYIVLALLVTVTVVVLLPVGNHLEPGTPSRVVGAVIFYFVYMSLIVLMWYRSQEDD